MIRRIARPPKNQRRFANCWGELSYVCDKMRYWLYAKKLRARAERYLARLSKILRTLPANEQAILREEGLAILDELKGRRSGAIAHRKREIELMEQLLREARSGKYDASTEAYMLRDRDEAALQDRKAILEALKSDGKTDGP